MRNSLKTTMAAVVMVGLAAVPFAQAATADCAGRIEATKPYASDPATAPLLGAENSIWAGPKLASPEG